MAKFKVSVVKYPDRENYVLRWVDPASGKQKTRSSGKSTKKDAEREAVKLEEVILSGQTDDLSKIKWREATERYLAEYVPGLKGTSCQKINVIFNVIEDVLKINRLADLTSQKIGHFQQSYRKLERSEATIHSYMNTLKAFLNWAKSQGLIREVPKITMPRLPRGSRAKGRPITLEEFERMLDKTESVVGEVAAESWKHLLNGLWWSGLRLSETLDLWWDREDKHYIDMTGDRPRIVISGAYEKGNRDRVMPLATEFESLLLEVPQDKRTGPVFAPLDKHGKPCARTRHTFGVRISKIGEAARVVVKQGANGKDSAAEKYASAHDLRRSFGVRWAHRLKDPMQLQKLMRHESIETTMKYYVSFDADSTQAAIDRGFKSTESVSKSNILSNTPQNQGVEE